MFYLVTAEGEDMKRCTECKLEKPLTSFNKQASGKYGVRSKCKACRKASRAKNATENRKKKNAKYRRDSEYRQRAKDRAKKRREGFSQEEREKANARRRERYALAPEKRRAANREWCSANPDKVLAQVHRRLAKKRGAPSDGWRHREVFESAGWRCFYCGIDVEQRQDTKTAQTNEAQADHFKPLSRGGTNERSNIVCSCGLCNQRKGSKDPFEFIRDNINQ